MAQNTGGVFPPGLGDNHRSAQYRIGQNLESDSTAHRVHFQQSFDARRAWRIVGQTRETGNSDFDFDFIQAELFWELGQLNSDYRTGLRFDARLRDNDRPGQLGVNWMNQWALNDGWSLRVNGLSSLQVGETSADGIGLAARAQIAKKLEGGATIGLQSFNGFGSTDDFSLTKKGHTLGPFVATKLGPVDVVGRILLGVSDAAPDADLGIWIGKSF